MRITARKDACQYLISCVFVIALLCFCRDLSYNNLMTDVGLPRGVFDQLTVLRML